MCAPNWKVHCRTRSSALQLRFQVSILSGPRDIAAYTVWLPPPRLNPGSKRKAISNARLCSRPALEPGLGSATRLLLGCFCCALWEAAITAGPGLPSSTAGQQNNPAAGTELLAAISVRGAAMGSVLSSDSSKSAPASATSRALERRREPELPVTSFDCSVCLEVLHQPVRTRCGHM